MTLQAAIDTLTDGDLLREMTRHNAAEFVNATAVVAEAARLVADPPPRTELIEDFVTELLRGDLINQNSSNIEGEIRQVVLNLTGRWDAALTGEE